jgi:hypothetical protein
MNTADFRYRMRCHLSSFVTESRRAALKLDGRLKVLMIDARNAPLSEDEITKITTEEMERADQRMSQIPRANCGPVLAVEDLQDV